MAFTHAINGGWTVGNLAALSGDKLVAIYVAALLFFLIAVFCSKKVN